MLLSHDDDDDDVLFEFTGRTVWCVRSPPRAVIPSLRQVPKYWKSLASAPFSRKGPISGKEIGFFRRNIKEFPRKKAPAVTFPTKSGIFSTSRPGCSLRLVSPLRNHPDFSSFTGRAWIGSLAAHRVSEIRLSDGDYRGGFWSRLAAEVCAVNANVALLTSDGTGFSWRLSSPNPPKNADPFSLSADRHRDFSLLTAHPGEREPAAGMLTPLIASPALVEDRVPKEENAHPPRTSTRVHSYPCASSRGVNTLQRFFLYIYESQQRHMQPNISLAIPAGPTRPNRVFLIFCPPSKYALAIHKKSKSNYLIVLYAYVCRTHHRST